MKVYVVWEFDIEDESIEAHNAFAIEQGIPLEIDLSDWFHDPASVDEGVITDALSDEYGWLIKYWDEIDS